MSVNAVFTLRELVNGRYLELFQLRLGVTGALNGAATDQLEVLESFNVPAKGFKSQIHHSS